MTEAEFVFEGQSINIQCNENQKMADICNKLCIKIKVELKKLIFLYAGNLLNLEKTFNEITKEKKINVLVYRQENKEYLNDKAQIDNKILDDIISFNNNTKYSLTGIIGQIENVIDAINKKKEINFINSQLKNANIVVKNINDDIIKMNNKLTQIKYGNAPIDINNEQDIVKKENKKEEKLKNEIICIYNKQKKEIDLLHDYKMDYIDEAGKLYLEAKVNISERYIDIYLNDKKIPFCYKYVSDEIGEIKVKFKFKKLLTSTGHMFYDCSSLIKIDLSEFNTINIKNMSFMFCCCSSLKSLDLSSFNTSKVEYMTQMFSGCNSLESLDLSSFDTNNVKFMNYLFHECYSLDKENVKINDDKGEKLLFELYKW